VQPALNSLLTAGTVVSVNLQYDARPIVVVPSSPPSSPPQPMPQIRVSYYADNCAHEAAVGYADLASGTSGTITLKVPVAAESVGKRLWHISARIVSGDTTLAAYGWPC